MPDFFNGGFPNRAVNLKSCPPAYTAGTASQFQVVPGVSDGNEERRSVPPFCLQTCLISSLARDVLRNEKYPGKQHFHQITNFKWEKKCPFPFVVVNVD